MKRVKKILAIFMVIVSALNMLMVEGFAADNSVMISAATVNGCPGDRVDVNVNIKNNPGILAATLKVEYPAGLILVDSDNGEAFSELTMMTPGRYNSPAVFSWDAQDVSEDSAIDGTILKLTFEIAENVENGEVLPIKVTSQRGDVYDADLNLIDIVYKEGAVQVIGYTPGDVNNDHRINASDIILTRRHIVGGYNVKINEDAANVNNDGRINSMDVTLMRRYIAGGYGVKLEPVVLKKCKDEKKEIKYKAPTCTENGNIAHWYCDKCDMYFADKEGKIEINKSDVAIAALGHTPVIDKAVPPTASKSGLTEGSHCGVCNMVLVAQRTWTLNGYAVTYDIANGDSYLSSIKIDNDENPAVIEKGGNAYLYDLAVPGYRFLGWYTSSVGGTQVSKIENADHNIKLYAHWEKIEYNIQFDSDLVKVDDMNYTTGSNKLLPTPKLSGYDFVGWSNDEGEIVKRIPANSSGNIELKANWLSKRNRAFAKKKLDKPIVYETDNKILVAYEIGKVENVPVSVIHDFGFINSSGVTKEITEEYSVTYSDSLMESYVKSIDKSTTNTSLWTLSNEWSDSVSVSEEYCEENGITQEEAKTIGTSSTDEWYVSDCSGGSTDKYDLDSDDTYNLTTKVERTTKEKSETDETEEKKEKSTKTHVDAKITAGYESEVGADIPIDSATLHASKKFSIEGSIEGGIENTENKSESETKTTGKKKSKENGSDDQKGTVKNHQSGTVTTSNWSHESGRKGSVTNEESITVAKALTQTISNKTGYGKTYINAGGESDTQGVETTEKSSEQYGSTVTHTTVTAETKTIKASTTNTEEGYHRWVAADTAHVFGVVEYDIATKNYTAYTTSIMENNPYEYEDYSYNAPRYDDNQTGVIEFHIPYTVNEYVMSRVFATNGLEINPEGYVTAYTGEDTYVIIPDYMTINNKDNGKPTVVKVVGIARDAFRGNTNITGIELSRYITEIQDGAFEGCTNLWQFFAGSLQSIGKEAFKNCPVLDDWTLGNALTTLGTDAFENATILTVDAANAEVVKNAVKSGSKNITIDMSAVKEGLDNTTLEIKPGTEKFVLNGYGNSYNDLVINSEAAETIINRVNITSTSDIPLQLSSKKVGLYQSNINSKGICTLLLADKTDVDLYGQNNLVSEGVNSLLLRSATFKQGTSGLSTKLNLTGSLLYCGTLDGISYINGTIKKVSEDELEKYLHSYNLYFDANGGSCSETQREVANSEKIGSLPTPTRTGYDFLGWYLVTGAKVTADDSFSTGQDLILTAKWAVKQYSISWNNASKCSISVKRTSSPYKDAATGTLANGSIIYYGDQISVAYTPNSGYSLSSSGGTSYTVSGNITSSDIYANTEANQYTYKVVYKSSNGTSLGSTTVTHYYGNSYTVSAPGKSGYTTPSSQNVSWDSTSDKTITFTYTPIGRSTKQTMASGHMDYWTSSSGRPSGIRFDAYAEYQNRTANSVQIRISYTNYCYAYTIFGYGQWFTPTINGSNCGETKIVDSSTWSGSATYERSASASSGWVTVPVSPTTTSVGLSSTWRTGNPTSGSWSGTITIPTY